MKSAMVPGAIALVVATITVAADRQNADDDWKRLAPLSSGERIFVAKLANAPRFSTGNTDPLSWFIEFQFDATESLRGAKPGAEFFHYSIVQEQQPAFSKETTWLVTAKFQHGYWHVTHLVAADKGLIAKAKVIAALPIVVSVN
jgi:hypothetical protein